MRFRSGEAIPEPALMTVVRARDSSLTEAAINMLVNTAILERRSPGDFVLCQWHMPWLNDHVSPI